jgi:hypothetical protein
MGAGICAVLVVASPLQILHPRYVLDQPGLMNIDTIATLFGLTIVTGCLKDFGAITWAMRLLKKRCASPRALMARVIALTTLLSALVTNDACTCVLSLLPRTFIGPGTLLRLATCPWRLRGRARLGNSRSTRYGRVCALSDWVAARMLGGMWLVTAGSS